MTVAQNLAFPLANRGVDQHEINKRVTDMLDTLELASKADRRAQGLTADEKQKISLGRGLVRYDVNAILFDEPLTVIDPHMKWQLRTKLKELHQRLGHTMIYVTHDQTEALTFADKVALGFEYDPPAGAKLELGVRPEFVRFARQNEYGVPVSVEKVDNVGRHRIAKVRLAEHSLNIMLEEGHQIPTYNIAIVCDPIRSGIYANEHRLEGRAISREGASLW